MPRNLNQMAGAAYVDVMGMKWCCVCVCVWFKVGRVKPYPPPTPFGTGPLTSIGGVSGAVEEAW